MEARTDTVMPADGSALCAYQYFENLRNFLVSVQDIGLPTFELSDLEKVFFLHFLLRAHAISSFSL